MRNEHKITDAAILVMKVGLHGVESLDKIIQRKNKEEADTGYCLWGYGGSLCHPLRVVKPFSAQMPYPTKIKVVFVRTASPFINTDSRRADEYSDDGLAWSSLPITTNVFASKFALVLKNLKESTETICLDDYAVALGPSAGTPLSKYVRFRVDKACALKRNIQPSSMEITPVAFTADLVEPYAILVRHQDTLSHPLDKQTLLSLK